MEEVTQDLKVVIGKNISQYRKLSGMSQFEFAEKLNYSDKAISKWERGESLPDIIILKQIADLFQITVNDLIEYKTKKNTLKSIKKLMHNKVFTLLLSMGIVWLVATIVFAFFLMFNVLTNYAWLAFVYAVPVCSLLGIIFTAIWKQKIPLTIFETLFIWTLGISVCLSIANIYSKVWFMLLIGIPLQVLILLWNFRKKKKFD